MIKAPLKVTAKSGCLEGKHEEHKRFKTFEHYCHCGYFAQKSHLAALLQSFCFSDVFSVKHNLFLFKTVTNWTHMQQKLDLYFMFGGDLPLQLVKRACHSQLD